jgi:hypothetical protein
MIEVQIIIAYSINIDKSGNNINLIYKLLKGFFLYNILVLFASFLRFLFYIFIYLIKVNSLIEYYLINISE